MLPTTPTTATSRPPGAAAALSRNASAATSAGGGGDARCDFCDRVGLPILPLRYAVVPSFLPERVHPPSVLPQLGKRLSHSELSGHRYALRTLRNGYVMVYFGAGLWNAYAVTEGGHLRKLADLDDPDFNTERELSVQCKSSGHNIPASFINIPALPAGGARRLPEKLWIAFSDVLWTRAVRAGYEGAAGAALRKARMQEFATAALGKAAASVDDALQLYPDEAATSSLLNTMVLEYASSAEQAMQRSEYDAIDPYQAGKRNHIKWTGAHGVQMRTGEHLAVARFCKTLTPSNREQLMASAVVLNDPVGMVQELNALRLAIAEDRQKYMSHESIARPLLVSQAIMGLKSFIGEQVAASVQADEEANGVPDRQTHVVAVPRGVPTMGGAYTYSNTRAERSAAKSTRLWAELQEYYRESERAQFDRNVAATLASFHTWLVLADADYALWFGKPDWVSRRDDYDPASPDQQDLLIQAFAPCLAGGPLADPQSTDPAKPHEGVKTYEVWVRYLGLHPADKANPVYVALFGEQKEFLDYLLPDGINPATESVDKGSKLYKVIKTVIATKEISSDTWTQFRQEGMRGLMADDRMVNGEMRPVRSPAGKVDNPVRVAGGAAMNAVRSSWVPKAADAAAHVLLALGGALARLGAEAIGVVYRATALRAVQGAVMLYERREIFLVTTRIRLREYLAYLNDAAFRTSASALSLASEPLRQVARNGQQTVRSMAVSGALRIGDPKLRDAFIEVMAFAYDDLGQIDQAVGEVAAEVERARSAHGAAQATRAAENAMMAAAMQIHPFSLSPQTRAFVDAVNAKARTLRIDGADVLRGLTRGSLRLTSTGSGMLAVGSLVMQGWSLKDNMNKADKAFLGNNEARVLVTAGTIATIGAVMEVAGVAGKLAAAKWSTRIGRIGSAIGGVASIVEGVQAGMAGIRARSHGDRDAMWLHLSASVALVVGGGLGVYGGLTSAALLGPVGWALIFIAAGVTLLYFAAKAEDTQAAIWLDRCYWGKGKRYGNARHPDDRPWSASQGQAEMAQLNAVVLGLTGQTGFNDDGWGLADWTWDTVKARITVPFFDSTTAAYEWRLVARGRRRQRSVTLARGHWGNLPDQPAVVALRNAPSRQSTDDSEYFRNLRVTHFDTGSLPDLSRVIEVSVEVRVKFFNDVELTATYVPDVLDPAGRADLALSERD